MLSAVLPINAPPIFNLALAPKIIPLGLIKNKFAVPLARINPSMLETCPPVTRVIMLLIVKTLLKNASDPVGRENSRKLWKRLPPAVVPPSILKVLPSKVTLELFGRVLSGTIWAIAGAFVAIAIIANKALADPNRLKPPIRFEAIFSHSRAPDQRL